MKFQIINLALAAAGASATLEVRLSHLDGTRVRASVTNVGAKTYNLLSRGSIFDPAPVRKLHVMNETSVAPFHGMSKQGCSHTALSQEDFMTMTAGQTFEHDLDIADLYDLDVDTYYISAKDSIPYAAEGSTELSGATLPMSGNQLQLTLGAFEHHELKKRTVIQDDCSSEQRSAVEAANKACVDLANAAADAAENGSEETFNSFFKDTSPTCRSQVADSFRKVAKECSALGGGDTKSSCTDPQNTCSGNLLAYTYWQTRGEEITDSTTYYCPRYFNGEILSPELSSYSQQSQGSNTLHEMTHALFATQDVAYGLDNVQALTKEQAIVNADTYTFYAIAVGIDGAKGGSSDGDDTYNNGGDNGGSPAPSPVPSAAPSEAPSAAPSEVLSAAPSSAPSAAPSPVPSPAPESDDSNNGSDDGSNSDSPDAYDAPAPYTGGSNGDGDSAAPDTGDSNDASSDESNGDAPSPDNGDSNADSDSPKPEDCDEESSNGDGNGGSNGGSTPSPDNDETAGANSGSTPSPDNEGADAGSPPSYGQGSNGGSGGDSNAGSGAASNSGSSSWSVPWSYSTKGSYKFWFA